MINASKEFKEKLKNGSKLANYADVTLSDGTVLHLDPKDFMIGGCQIEDKTSDGKFGVGFCIGKTLKIRLENDDERFSSYDFYMATITIYVAMLLDDGTIEKIRKGKYYAAVPQTQGDIIDISAVDAMYRLDRPYAATTVYPATLQSIISDICLDCGIPAGFQRFDNYTYTVKEKPENLTYRQVLSYACQVAGYNARIDNDGYMQLIWYNTSLLNWYNYNGGSFKTYQHDTILDGGDFTNYGQGEQISGGEFTDARPEHIFRIKSLTVHTDDVVITGVKVIGKDDVTALFGEDGYAIVVKGNPFVDGRESEVAAYLGGRMVGVTFRPFSAQILGNPLYEPFEVVMVSDRNGNVYNSIVNSISYKIGAYTAVSCQAEDPVRNGSEYISPTVQAAVAEARKNAEKQLTSYDKAVQQMNQIAINTLGYHVTYENQPDGGRITYLHDKPMLEDSTTIYKIGIDGFFVSQDGGQSYTAGFDKNGNAVVNILYAIGIVCDWIRGGTLTLGGINNADGVLNLVNASGDLLARMDNTGLTVYKGIIQGTDLYLGGLNNKNGSLVVYNGNGLEVGRFDKNGLRATNGYFEGEIKSTSAEITGGYFKVSASSSETSSIDIKYGRDASYLAPNYLKLSKNNYISYYRADRIAMSYDSGSSEQMFFEASKELLYTSGGFASGGQKSRSVKTKDYSDRLLYCYETAKPYFGDIGEATLDENGICYIFLDGIFSETINTDCQYQVFLQKYNPGDVWVEERTENCFIVHGTPGIRFGWEIKARQLGFETERLERFSQVEREEPINYETEAQNYIENFYKEVFEYEESN